MQRRVRVWSRAVRYIKAVDHGERCSVGLDLKDRAAQGRASTRSHSVQEAVTALHHSGRGRNAIGPVAVVEVVDHGVNARGSQFVHGARTEAAARRRGAVEVSVGRLQDGPEGNSAGRIVEAEN